MQEGAFVSQATVKLSRIPKLSFHSCFYVALHPDYIHLFLKGVAPDVHWGLLSPVSALLFAGHRALSKSPESFSVSSFSSVKWILWYSPKLLLRIFWRSEWDGRCFKDRSERHASIVIIILWWRWLDPPLQEGVWSVERSLLISVPVGALGPGHLASLASLFLATQWPPVCLSNFGELFF